MSDVSSGAWWRSAAFVGLVSGVVSGVLAGWLSANLSVVPKMSDLERIWQDRLAYVTSTLSPASSTLPVVSLDPIRPSLPVYPEAFLNRRFSPVLAVVKRTSPTPRPEAVVGPERTLGYAVSLTSDGWLVVPSSVLANGTRSDLGIVWKNRWHPITKGIVDPAFEVGFVKIEATGLPVTGFARATDITAGTQVWLEAQSGAILPEIILRTDGRATGTDLVSSERPARRFLLASSEVTGRVGGAVWNGTGDLVGIVTQSSKGVLQILPGSVLSSILSQALSAQEIRRASLEVRVMDLAHTVFEDRNATFPLQGVWVRSVTATGTTDLLKEGDVIERIERDVFDGTVDLGERLLDYRPGSNVTLSGTRQGKPFELSLKLGTTTTSEILK